MIIILWGDDMPIVNCSVSDCSYNKGKKCKRSGIGIFKDSYYDTNDTVCGNFKPSDRSNLLNEIATEFMGYPSTRVKCTADTCRHNKDMKCEAKNLEVAALSSKTLIGSETFCASFVE